MPANSFAMGRHKSVDSLRERFESASVPSPQDLASVSAWRCQEYDVTSDAPIGMGELKMKFVTQSGRVVDQLGGAEFVYSRSALEFPADISVSNFKESIRMVDAHTLMIEKAVSEDFFKLISSPQVNPETRRSISHPKLIAERYLTCNWREEKGMNRFPASRGSARSS
jgi:hypothetical protein